MKILLTGATGYIGKRLLPILVKEGHEVVCCVRDKNRFYCPIEFQKNVSVIEVDFLKIETLTAIPNNIDAAYYLIHSMSDPDENYDDLETMYGHVISQFNRYMGHVSANLGGVYENFKTSDQEGLVYTHVDKTHQKNCLNFINDQLFSTPNWLIDKEIIGRTEYSGITERIRSTQVKTLNNILDLGTMMRMVENETLNGTKAYTLISMMTDLRNGIWSELSTGKNIDTYRRNLQRAHVERLGELLNSKDVKVSSKSSYVKATAVTVKESDIIPIVRGELNKIKKDAYRASLATTNTVKKYHLQDISDRIEAILNPK